MSVLVLKPATSLAVGISRMKGVIGEAFAMFAAAGAAAAALENQRQPSEADLRVLGMEGVRFKHF